VAIKHVRILTQSNQERLTKAGHISISSDYF